LTCLRSLTLICLAAGGLLSGCGSASFDHYYRLRLWEQNMSDALEAERHGEHAVALRKCREALPETDRLGTPERRYSSLACLADSLRQDGDCRTSVQLYKKAVAVCRQSALSAQQSYRKEDLGDLLCGLGESLLCNDAAPAACKVLQEAMSLQKAPSAGSGRACINVLASMRWGHACALLGQAYLIEKNIPEALKLYEEVERLLPYENVAREDLKLLAAGLNRLQSLQKQNGAAENDRLGKLRKHLVTSLKVARQSGSILEELVHSYNGSDDLTFAQVKRLVSFHKKTRDYASAEKILRKALERERRAKPVNDRLVALLSQDLAGVLIRRGNYLEAERLLAPIVEQLKKNPGLCDISDRVDIYWRMADAFEKQKKYREAELCLAPMINWNLKDLKILEDDVSAMSVYCRELAHCLAEQGKLQPALYWYRKALTFVNTDEKQEDNAILYYDFGRALKAGGLPGEAVISYRKAARIFEKLEKSEELNKCRIEAQDIGGIGAALRITE
jgi:tetratricopeptide (TPR) repeat protein